MTPGDRAGKASGRNPMRLPAAARIKGGSPNATLSNRWRACSTPVCAMRPHSPHSPGVPLRLRLMIVIEP